MLRRFSAIQPLVKAAAQRLEEDQSLALLARQAGFSRFHLHRAFTAVAGETPKQFVSRMRLDRSAALLLTTRSSILDIALTCGFRSPEVFCRSFRQRFGILPSKYRQRGFAQSLTESDARRHAKFVEEISPCIGFYGIRSFEEKPMIYTITKKDIQPQPILFMRRRVARSEIAATIPVCLGRIFGYAQANGIGLGGHPLTRYIDSSQGMVTMEPAVRIQASVENAASEPGDEGVLFDNLPGGLVAVTTHCGPYDRLQDAYAALERWIAEQGLVAAGAPWEHYVTDPGAEPDPQKWATDVYWPLAR